MSKTERYTICPGENTLARFMEGTLSGEMMLYVKQHLETCPDCNSAVLLAMELNSIPFSEPPAEYASDIVTDFAALADRKLCVLYMEQYILNSAGYEKSIDELLEIAKQNHWIKHQGVQFRNIGRLLEYFSMDVQRKTHATLSDLQAALARGNKVIVGVDAGELFASNILKKLAEEIEDLFEQHADHVALVTRVPESADGFVEILNLDQQGVSPYKVSLKRFLDAWADSKNFMVMVNIKS